MKMNICRPIRFNHGNTLLIVMGTVIVLGIVLAAVLRLAIQENRILARTTAWNAALPVAESGIEEALSHLCRVNLGNRATNGWQLDGSSHVIVRSNLSNGKFRVGISAGTPPIIRSLGQAWCPSAGRYIDRTVQVTTRWLPEMPGLVAKTKAEMQGSTRADSYDSDNALYSTNGKYDPAKFTDQALIGCLQGDVYVNGLAKIYGDVGSASGNVYPELVTVKVGDTAWVNSLLTAGIQTGHTETNLSMSTPDVLAPFANAPGIPVTRVLSSGNFKVTDYTLALGQTLRVFGDVTLYVANTIYIRGEVIIEKGGNLKLYVGSQFYAEGSGKINVNGTPDQFSYYGLNSNLEVYFQGSSKVVGTVYAPYAKMYVQDTSEFSGAGMCYDLVFQGESKFHYDEMLGRIGQPFMITSWTEL